MSAMVVSYGVTVNLMAWAISFVVWGSINVSQTDIRAELAAPHKRHGGSSAKLRGLVTNPHRDFGPQIWHAFRDAVAHLYTLSLPEPSEEARFTLSTHTYATPNGILMRCQGTAFMMTRGPALVAHGADQLGIVLHIAGSVDAEYHGRRARREAGDVVITDYARPFRGATTDYENLMVVIRRESVPAGLLAMEPHGLLFPRESGAARLIGTALQEFFKQADDLTVSEAEAAIEGIVALTTACARTKLAGGELNHLKSRRKAALDYIDTHFADTRLGPDEIAEAASLSRASLYRLLAAEGGVRAVLLKRRLDEALRLMLEGNGEEHSLKKIVKRCGFGGTSQFGRVFRARFGMAPRQYRALVLRQGLDWHETRLTADGFDPDAFLWRHRKLRKSKKSNGPG